MLPSLQSLFLPIFGFVLFCTTTEILPRAPHAALEPPGFVGLHDVVVARRGDLDLPSALLPRMSRPANGISANSSSALNKRQDTCGSGYGLCDVSQLCCPLGWGCCDDGNCVTDGETCCSAGGICESGWSCCGTFGTCSPNDGECCADGSYCYGGLHCVILDGIQGCCANLDCTAFNSGPSVPPPPSITIPSFTPISITPPSITPISSAPNTHLSIPTLTVPASLTIEYTWYTTTFFWTYYSWFITYIEDVSQTTSQYFSTSTIVSVYATNTADANSQFATQSSQINAKTAVTAPGLTNSLPSPTITLPSITIPSITVPTSLTTEYFWYTTTFTWYYYSYFITYIAPVSQRTSRYTSTTQIVSVYASNTADATSQLATLSSEFSFPTAVTAPGYTNSLPSATGSISSGPTISAFTGGAKGVKTGFGGLGAAALLGCLGILTCLLMVWL